MTVRIGPVGQAGIPVQVRGSDAPRTPAVVVHRGLGGGTQTVWAATPAQAGTTLLVRVSAAELPALDALAAHSGPVEVTSDGTCPVTTGIGAITRYDVTWRYDVSPPAADVSIEVTW